MLRTQGEGAQGEVRPTSSCCRIAVALQPWCVVPDRGEAESRLGDQETGYIYKAKEVTPIGPSALTLANEVAVKVKVGS